MSLGLKHHGAVGLADESRIEQSSPQELPHRIPRGKHVSGVPCHYEPLLERFQVKDRDRAKGADEPVVAEL